MKDLRNPQIRKQTNIPDPIDVWSRAKRIFPYAPQKLLAEKLGVTQQQVSQAFKGIQPGLLLRISDYLKPIELKHKRKNVTRVA